MNTLNVARLRLQLGSVFVLDYGSLLPHFSASQKIRIISLTQGISNPLLIIFLCLGVYMGYRNAPDGIWDFGFPQISGHSSLPVP
jgi:hypothetical protein